MNILLYCTSSAQECSYKKLLGNNNIKVDIFSSDILLIKRIFYYDAILFLNSPEYNHWELIKRSIGGNNIKIPLIFAGGSNTKGVRLEEDRINSIHFNKQLSQHEIIQLTKEILIRCSIQKDQFKLSLEGITLNRYQWSVVIKGKKASLTRKEFHILELFIINKGEIVSKKQIANIVWDKRVYVSSNTIEVYICRLRKKLKSLDDRVWIQTIPCIGYEFKI